MPPTRRHLLGILGVLAAILTACSASAPTAAGLAGVVIEPATPRPAFELVDTTGATYDFATETSGKLTLLYFGYTFCPDICPVHLAQIAETFDELPEIGRNAEVVFVTVDPARDTPERLREYLDNFDERFIGLTGTPEQLAAAQTAAGVPVAFQDSEGEDYTIGHAGQVIVYAPDDLSYTQYPFGTRQSDWITDLPLLAERSGS